MAVPGFQAMFIHLLRCLEDGRTLHTSAIRDHVAATMEISEEDQHEMVPSGKSTRLANRVSWARTHLSKAGLIEQVSRANYRISEQGRAVLMDPPPNLDLKYLDTIPSHKNWFHAPKKGSHNRDERDENNGKTPEERIEEAFVELNATLASSLLESMASMNAFQFEQLVVDLLFAMGYGGSREEAARVTKRSNDEGIDGIISEDRLGLDVIYIQAKRWQNTIGRKEIQSFVGALAGKQANKGVFITTSDFAQTATDYSQSVTQKVILIDGVRLAALMIEHDIGVSTIGSVDLKRIDSDYFEEN